MNLITSIFLFNMMEYLRKKSGEDVSPRDFIETAIDMFLNLEESSEDNEKLKDIVVQDLLEYVIGPAIHTKNFLEFKPAKETFQSGSLQEFIKVVKF